jgi:hypothetical protein
MIRKWIPLANLAIYDEMHRPSESGFKVDETKDGETTEEHRAGIDFIKGKMEAGLKVLPILALDNEDGTYQRLDGFKRCIAHLELGYSIIEAFVCTREEYDRADFFPFLDKQMRAWHGGQDGEQGKFPLHEGAEGKELIFLYKSPNPDGLRIEISESIHVHWSKFGQYRLSLGRNDFIELANAISQIWEK